MSENASALRIAQRFHDLSAQQQRAVYQKIVSEGMSVSQFPILPRSAPWQQSCALSYAQQRQWFLWQLDPQSTAYHVAGAIQLEGVLDIDALRKSFRILYRRHESLRTIFTMDQDGNVAQNILSPDEHPFAIEEIDLSGEIAQVKSVRLNTEIQRLRATPFDLRKGPLLRVAAIRLGQGLHVLVVVKHHIISDGWSLQIIVNEFVSCYRSLVSGVPSALTPSPVQYADYALWQRDWLEAGEKERQLSYWRNQLGGGDPVLQLHTDFPREQDNRYTAAAIEICLPDILVRQLRARVHADEASLFMALLAGFQCLLQRYTGTSDIRVGVPVANRHRIETETVVGFFVNTQVLRVVIDRDSLLGDILTCTKLSVLAAQDYQDLPFEQLVEDLRPQRIFGTNPLFQVLFNHQQFDHDGLQQLPELVVSDFSLGDQAAQFELALDTTETRAGQVRARFTYAAELFEARTIERMAGHYVNLLWAIAEQPTKRVGDVELLTPDELSQLRRWGVNEQAYVSKEPNPEAVHRLFERWAQAQPEATALIFDAETVSYSELNHRANQLARHLISRNVGVEAKIGIAMQRSVDMVVAVLGVLKAGATYVPLDPEYPSERLAYMIADSGIALLLTQSALLSQLPFPDTLPVLALDTVALDRERNTNPAVALHGDNLAYVIYTSGSTGKPKGVAVSHAPLCMHCQETATLYDMDNQSRELHFVSFSFDGGQERLLTALTCGASLVLRDSTLWTTEKTLTVLQQYAVTNAGFPPAYLCELANAARELASPPPVSLYSFGGDAMPRDGVEAVCRHLQPQKLINGYGPTEAVITPVLWKADAATQFQSGYAPIGRPVGDRSAYVLDADLNLAPQGVPGELYLGGIGLARGYLGKAALTAERFVANPFDARGGRLYRTGDRVRWNAEGQLEYLGRIDQQLKIRGFRIEPGEVEAQLLAQAGVREAIVIASGEAASARLLGYVSAQEGVEVDGALLRRELGQTLPEYMVPAAIVVLSRLPLSPNGKIDRKALPAVANDEKRGYEAPYGDIEQALAQIWARVLDVARVGRHDNFFDLGGHSLLAIRLLEQLRQQGWQTDIRTLFRYPRFCDFAQQVIGLAAQARQPVEVPPNNIPANCLSIKPDMLTLISLDRAQIRGIEGAVPGGAANIQDIYPLAPLQEGILFHHLLQTSGDPYITPCLLSFDSRARLEKFVDCLNLVIARHDALRTSVLWDGLPEPVQVVWRRASVPITWLAEQPDDAEARLNHFVDRVRFGIDVRQAPMIRAIAVADNLRQRWLLQLPSHHLALDHTTLELLVQEITLLLQGRDAELPKPVPFRDFVAQARCGVSIAEHEEFFRQMLLGVDEPTAPFDLLDVRGDGAQTHEVSHVLPAELSQRIRQQARARGVSAATLFHLAWACVLARTSGKDDVVFGTVLFGRMQGGADATRAMGMFINTLPVRIQLDQPLSQCLQQTHRTLTDLLHHEHASLMLAQRCSALPNGMPLFSALLNYRYSPPADDDLTSSWLGMQVHGGQERTNFPLDMSVDDLGDDFSLVLQACNSIDASSVCRFLERALHELAFALASENDVKPSTLELLGDDDLLRLQRWGINDRRDANMEAVHRLFERHAQSQPQATALIFEAELVSYDELNRRANRLAHHLIERGIGIEFKIGIALGRSVDMVVALLGVLKAGAAYVPLDPDYPPERLAYMIADSGIALLLTQSALHAQLPLPATLPVLALDTVTFDKDSTTNPAVAVHDDNLAYVIYTSGSTGKPKGVAVSQRVFAQHMQVTGAFFHLTASDRMLQFATINFDAFVEQLFAPLTAGASVVLRADEVWDSETFYRELLDKRITTVDLTTAYATVLVQEFGRSGKRDYGALRQLHVGGEALSPQFPALWRAAGLEHVTLLNTYGPTEAAVTATTFDCRGLVKASGVATVPIGTPLGGRRVYVLDCCLELAPVGVAGELFIGGELLARGYLGRAALTAERFIADPFDARGGRLYRTGDRVRWNTEGRLEYLGRIDQQLKIRGFRVEPGEIEAQLLAQNGVREAIVIASGEAASARLLAYVSAQEGVEIDGAALRETLAQTLPDYMVPAAIVVLPRLPMSPNGKVDRKALPAVASDRNRRYEAPQGDVEQALAQLWAGVLDIARVGRHDNFFDLGGHSLAAIQIKAQLAQQHACEIQIRQLFDFPTVSALATQLPVELFCSGAKSSRFAAMDELLSEFEV